LRPSETRNRKTLRWRKPCNVPVLASDADPLLTRDSAQTTRKADLQVF
jgi:hypothetical protein